MSYSVYLKSLSGREGEFECKQVVVDSDTKYSTDRVVFVFDCSGSTLCTVGRTRGCSVREHLEPSESDCHEYKTKHISLAIVESMSVILNMLAQTIIKDIRVTIVQFDSTASITFDTVVPVGIEILKNIAQTLPDKLQAPKGGGTLLSGGLHAAELSHENTLLVILTDGHCSDMQKVDEIMTKYIDDIDMIGKCLDIFIVGAGSIGLTEVKKVISDEELVINLEQTTLSRYSTRISTFSHVYGSSSGFAGSECNRAYLMKLAQMHTILGRSAYAGAYRDYSFLIKQFNLFLRGDLDNTKFVYVSNNTGGWWHAKEHQYAIANAAFANPELTIYDRDTFKVFIKKEGRTENTLQIVDELGVERTYIVTNGRMK